MGETLAEYEGSKGNTYQITRGKDGVVYCNCWAWRMSKDKPRNCKHLDKYFNKGFTPALPSQPVSTTPTPCGSMKTADEVINAVDPKVWDVEEGS